MIYGFELSLQISCSGFRAFVESTQLFYSRSYAGTLTLRDEEMECLVSFFIYMRKYNSSTDTHNGDSSKTGIYMLGK